MFRKLVRTGRIETAAAATNPTTTTSVQLTTAAVERSIEQGRQHRVASQSLPQLNKRQPHQNDASQPTNLLDYSAENDALVSNPAEARLAAATRKAKSLIAPVFGVSALKMFPCIAACIIICAYDLMPFGLSELLLIPVVYVVLKYYDNQKRRLDRATALGLVKDPEILAIVASEMPMWYTFKDVETTKWLNECVQQLWPYIDAGVSRQLREDVLPPLLKQIPGVSVELTKVTLGCIAPAITSIRSSHASKKEVFIDIELKWNADLYVLLKVDFKLFPFPLEIMNMSFSGLLRVKLNPLIPFSPFVGGIQLSFLTKPSVDFAFRVMGLDAMSVSIPFVLDVAKTVTGSIKDALENIMVYPTHYVIPLTDEDALGASEFTRPPPVGILRVTVIEGKDLPRMDRGASIPGVNFEFGGRTSSDPYVRLHLKETNEDFKTDVVKKNHKNPKWDARTATFELLIWDVEISVLRVEALDHDAYSKDDLIGYAELRLKTLVPNQLEFHELGVALTEAAAKDPKCRYPVILLKTTYFPCGPLWTKTEPSENAFASEVDGTDEARVVAAKKGADIGILIVKNLELQGVVGKGRLLTNSKLKIKMGLVNYFQESKKKINKALPYSVTWLESFYFVLKAPAKATIRLSVMQHPSSMASAGNAMMGGEAKDVEIGFVDVAIPDVLSSVGTYEVSGQHFESDRGFGELSFSLVFNPATPDPGEASISSLKL